LNSAGSRAGATGVPHSLQNLAVAFNCVPHDLHDSVAVVIRRPDSLVNSPAAAELQCGTRPCQLRPRAIGAPALDDFEEGDACLHTAQLEIV
jgi:hypothetical protein